MNVKSPRLGLCGAAILICIAGFAASVVPAASYTDPFWGLSGFVDKELFASSDAPGVIITQVDSGSPAASAGLRKGDRLVTVNGARVEFGTARQLVNGIRPRERVILEVNRGGQYLRLVTEGEIPTLEAVLFLDWQFVSAPVFLVLLLLLVATQPLKPPPLWRAILITLGGLAVITATVIIEVTQWLPWTAVWRLKSFSHGFSPTLHYSLMIAVLVLGLALCILGALAVRAALMSVAAKPVSRAP